MCTNKGLVVNEFSFVVVNSALVIGDDLIVDDVTKISVLSPEPSVQSSVTFGAVVVVVRRVVVQWNASKGRSPTVAPLKCMGMAHSISSASGKSCERNKKKSVKHLQLHTSLIAAGAS